ncbi:MAG: hypothetical protein K2O97_12980 [Acetatifactor sp.]|nr:hypothetical protein [Acetatifactor sp.]
MIIINKTKSCETAEYKNKIMNEICSSGELVRLLGCEEETDPEQVIPFRYSFPHEYIPDTFTGTERYINFDISSSADPKNNTFRNLTICFYVVCHEAAVRYDENGQTGLWYDRAAYELEHILCGKKFPGTGRTTLSSNEPYSPHKKLKGRLLKFTTKDFSRPPGASRTKNPEEILA